MENDPSIIIRKGSFISNQTIQKSTKKHFIFDLDETIGSFAELNILWLGLIDICQHKNASIFQENPQILFNQILDTYPEFLRHGIITILEFLYYKKQLDECGNVYIYTNNQCISGDMNCPSWTMLIIKYIETVGKMNNGLFEPPILRYKKEVKRTTNSKTFGDLIRCTLLPKTAEFCFIDNTYFPKMTNGRVFYIQPQPYFHSLGVDEIVRRLLISNLGNRIVQECKMEADDFKRQLYDIFLLHDFTINSNMNKTVEERNMDISISQKLMYYIRDFFYLSLRKPKTKKMRAKIWYNVSKKLRKK